jgi:uncharacterized membrane protein
MLTLLGVGVVVLGFLLRFNPLLVIAAASSTRSRPWATPSTRAGW